MNHPSRQSPEMTAGMQADLISFLNIEKPLNGDVSSVLKPINLLVHALKYGEIEGDLTGLMQEQDQLADLQNREEGFEGDVSGAAPEKITDRVKIFIVKCLKAIPLEIAA